MFFKKRLYASVYGAAKRTAMEEMRNEYLSTDGRPGSKILVAVFDRFFDHNVIKALYQKSA
jgi:hypothetical protein